MEDADRHQGQHDKPFRGGQRDEHLSARRLTEARKIRRPSLFSRQFGLFRSPKVVGQAAQEILEDIKHHFNLCPEAVDGDDGQRGKGQIRRHQDESLCPMLHQHEAKQAADRFPQEIETTLGDGGCGAVESDFCSGKGHTRGVVKQRHQLHLLLFPKPWDMLVRDEVADRTLFGTSDDMNHPCPGGRESLIEDQKGGTDGKVGIQDGITRTSKSVCGGHQEARHPGDHRRGLSLEPLRGTQGIHAFMQFPPQRRTERFLERAGQESDHAPVMSPNRRFFAVVGRILTVGFDPWHLSRFFGHFDTIANQERTPLKGHQGTHGGHPGGPDRHQGGDAPGGGRQEMHQ